MNNGRRQPCGREMRSPFNSQAAISIRTARNMATAPEGHHAGDMPNPHIPQTGELVVEVLKPAVTLEQGKPNSVFGPNGTAIVIHAGVDDYKTDPTGNAGGVSPAASSNSSRAQAGLSPGTSAGPARLVP